MCLLEHCFEVQPSPTEAVKTSKSAKSVVFILHVKMLHKCFLKTLSFINSIATAWNCGMQLSPVVINDKNRPTSAGAGPLPDQNSGLQSLHVNAQNLAGNPYKRYPLTLSESGKSHIIFWSSIWLAQRIIRAFYRPVLLHQIIGLHHVHRYVPR